MNNIVSLVLFGTLIIVSLGVQSKTVDITQEKVEQWRDLKFGLFIHWGLYSLAGGVWNGEIVENGYSEQIQSHAKIPKLEYKKLADQFNPEDFDPEKIVQLAKNAGMKYVVLTGKHHDGFSMFHTKHSEYNVVDATPFKRDILKMLAEECRKQGIGLGIYFSLIDWDFYGALPMSDHNSDEIPKLHEEFNLNQIRELMENYGDIVEFWFDMGKPTLAQSEKFSGIVRSMQPSTMISGRIWNNQGDFLVMGDNKIPSEKIDAPWQTPASIYNETWGYRSWQQRADLKGNTRQKIASLANVVSKGGNYLLNIGPKGDGSLVSYEEELLQNVGEWMAVNGESIHSAEENPFEKELDFGYVTRKKGRLYLHLTDPSFDGEISLPGFKNPISRIQVLGGRKGERVSYSWRAGCVRINISRIQPGSNGHRVVALDYIGELSILPKDIIHFNLYGYILLSDKNATRSFGYAGEDYYSMARTSIKLTWKTVLELGRYSISVQCDRSPYIYSLDIGRRRFPFQCKGDTSMMLDEVLTVSRKEISDASIKLSSPSYPMQDLSLKNIVIKIQGIKD